MYVYWYVYGTSHVYILLIIHTLKIYRYTSYMSRNISLFTTVHTMHLSHIEYIPVYLECSLSTTHHTPNIQYTHICREIFP
jgi:hypothetical protein